MRHYLWKARAYYRQVAGLLAMGAACGIVMNIAVVLPAILLGKTIDAALAWEQGRATGRAVLLAALAYVGGSALFFVMRMGKRWWLRTAVRRTVLTIQADALRGALAQPMEWLHQQPVGDLMSRIIGDTQVFGVGFNEATTELLDTWLFSISLLIAMIAYDPLLTLLVMLLVPAALLLAYFSRGWVTRRTAATRQANADLTAALQERLSGVRILRLFGGAESAIRRIEELARRLERANLSETRLQVGLQPIYSFLITSGVVLLVWLGGQKVIRGDMTTGALVAFMQLYLRFVNRGYRLPLFFNRLQSAGVAWDRLEKLLAPPLAMAGEPPRASFNPRHTMGLAADPPAPSPAPSGPLAAQLHNASFRYPGGAGLALDHVSLDIPAGAFIAVTGPIGSGKSALLRLLGGLYQAQEGRVLLDGCAAYDLPQAERAQRIGYLPQAPGLFAGTVRENIGLDDHDGALLDRVVAAAGLQQDIEQFPKGLDTQIGEGGVQVSGGQGQRIALARALAVSRGRSLGILLLDDPFAAVDVETEGRIVAALRESFGPLAPPERRVTLVLCSHRLAAFQYADRVVLLDKGRVAAQGAHAELMAQGGLYARIYRAQHQIQAPNDTPTEGAAA